MPVGALTVWDLKALTHLAQDVMAGLAKMCGQLAAELHGRTRVDQDEIMASRTTRGATRFRLDIR